jgi:23S rRNA pseudouridine1911/1915/1917 synthase
MQKSYLTFLIKKNKEGELLQTFLRKNLKEIPSLKITKNILEKNLVTINSKIQKYGSYRLKKNDIIKVSINYKSLLDKKPLNIKILYEDEYILVIDKPINFISTDQNLHNFFDKKYCLIHRLDKDTTGVLLIAKNTKVKEKFISLFKNFKIEKLYLAIVNGVVKKDDFKIEKNIALLEEKNNQKIYGIKKEGKTAITLVKVLKRYLNETLVLLKPLTGRTHQLRVHLSFLNHPVLADNVYSKAISNKATRLMLHSYKISFIHPYLNKKFIVYSLPKDDMIEVCPFLKNINIKDLNENFNS